MIAIGPYTASVPPWLTVCLIAMIMSAIAYHIGYMRATVKGFAAGYADCRAWHTAAFQYMRERNQLHALELVLDALIATKDHRS